MTELEIQKAQKIIDEFPKWTRPMSTEESDLVERYHEFRTNQILSDRDNWDSINYE